MRHNRTLLLVLLLLPAPLAACLWDRDTPVDEARGLPEIVAVITGRFPRNPPRFYEMRLDRVTAFLRGHPDDLNAHDDAGVACDRLGRGAEAVAWMDRKRTRLEALDPARAEVKDHWYRYHANLGTFLVHRWVREGARRDQLDAVKSARAEIAEALKINPDAHFGREKYQLQALDWLSNPPSAKNVFEFPNLLGWSFADIYGTDTDPQDAHDAVRSLAGLVVLGNAWESVDIFHALNLALQRDSVGYTRGRNGGRNTLAYLAWLRARELVAAGKTSMLPDAPRGEALAALLPRPDFVAADQLLDPAYQKLRAEAEAWQTHRTAFLTERLKQGRHPDTDPHFWDGYTESPPPKLPTQSVPGAYEARRAFQMRLAKWILFGVPASGAVAIFAFSQWRKRRRQPDQALAGNAAP